MANRDDIEISRQLERIVRGGEQLRYPVMTGKIDSVDTDAMTCVVQLTVDDGVATEDVTLNVVLESKNGFYHVPAAGADCLVLEVDGPGRWELLKASEYDRVYVKGGGKFIDVKDAAVLLNGDGKGGLVQIQELKDNLDKLKDYIKNTLEPAISSGLTAVGVGMAANGGTGAASFNTATATQVIVFKDMENKNVKHG